MKTQPLLDFEAGYVLRAIDRLPKQGEREPWYLAQDYFKDARYLRRGDVEDGEMRFFAAGAPAPPLRRAGPRGMTSVTGKVAAVTGAGSGIGRALAVELASRGARLALSDVNEAGLAGSAELVEQRGATAHTQVLDVGDRDAVAAYADEVAAHHGVVHQIYNNAGIAFSRSVLESTYEDYERILQVNLWGVIHGTKAFLPHLIASGDGHVVNVSSLNGYLAQGGMTHYCTSKFAVRGFTEAVRMEMLQRGPPGRRSRASTRAGSRPTSPTPR